MRYAQEKLREFHKKFSHTIHNTPTIPDIATQKLREKLIKEEVKELLDAMEENSIIKIADGIADTLYVVIGTAVTYGIEIEPVFDEVHRSNMTKVWPDGEVKKNEFGKVIKPDTYSKANIAEALEKGVRRD